MEKEEVKKAFLELKSRKDVANLLGIKDRSLRYFLYKRRPETMYHTFTLYKRNGSPRQISAPNIELKAIQRKLADILSCVYDPKVCAYGFISQKNIVGNASQHTKRPLVLNIDLQDFFSQIHFGRVRGMLMKPPYSIGKEAATTIAQIACKDGILPQGAPSSPIITNMICVPLDNSLMKLAKSTECVYTRYADDITFSTYRKAFDTQIVVEGETLRIGARLENILDKHSFVVNPNKITLRHYASRQEVTGLTVNVFPNVRRSYTRNLRAILHNCKTDGIYNAAKKYVGKGYCKNAMIESIISNPEKQAVVEEWFLSVLKGKINYIKQVKGARNLSYLAFAQQLNTIAQDIIFDISELSNLEVIAEKSVFVAECSMDDSYDQGSAFYVPQIGLITSYHVVQRGGFFKVYDYREYPTSHVDVIGLECKLLSTDKTIDYAIFDTSPSIDANCKLSIGDSTKLRVGDQVTIIGYPNHQEGNSPYIQSCYITSKKLFLNAPFFTVSGRIVHGMSGGVVLNSNYEAIGIIKGGVQTFRDDDDNENQGFIPIHLAIEHMHQTLNPSD